MDDDFSDDLDLDEDTYAALEKEAIQQTQAQPFATALNTHNNNYTPPSTHHHARPITSTNRTTQPLTALTRPDTRPQLNGANPLNRYPQYGGRPQQQRPTHPLQQSRTAAPVVPQPGRKASLRSDESTDYSGKNDVEVGDLYDTADGTAPTMPAYRTAPSKQTPRVFKLESSDDEAEPMPPIDFTVHLQRPPEIDGSQEEHALPPIQKHDPEKEALRQELEQMRREKAKLQEELKAKTIQVYAKSGEAENMRKQAELEKQKCEKAVEAMRKQKEEDAQRALEQAEAMRREQAKIENDLTFMKQNMAELSKRNKDLERNRASTQKQSTVVQSPVTTPRKNRAAAYRSGFDRDPPPQMSPSKNRRQAPSPSTKRKRPEPDSPSLPITKDKPPSFNLDTRGPEIDEKMLARLHVDEENIDFTETFMAVAPPPLHKPTLESLAHYSVPGRHNMSFATLFIEEMAGRSIKDDFVAATCLVLINLWQICQNTGYWEPHVSIVWLFRFCLDWASTKTVGLFLDDFCVLVQETIDLACGPRMVELNEAYKISEEVPIPAGLDADGSLEAMLHVGMFAQSDRALRARFLDKLTINTGIRLLSVRQDLNHIRLILEILTLTIKPDSFGPRSSENGTSVGAEITILSFISRLLSPATSTKEPTSYTDPDLGRPHPSITLLRISILRFINHLTETPAGCKRIAEHKIFICALIHRLSLEVQEMSTFAAGVSHSVTFINAAIAILWKIFTRFEWDQTHLNERFAAVPDTGNHFMTAVARVAFSGRLAQERGLEPEVVKKALGLLEVVDGDDEVGGVFRREVELMEMEVDPELEMM